MQKARRTEVSPCFGLLFIVTLIAQEIGQLPDPVGDIFEVTSFHEFARMLVSLRLFDVDLRFL